MVSLPFRYGIQNELSAPGLSFEALAAAARNTPMGRKLASMAVFLG